MNKVKKRNPFIAFLLSLFLPAGQVYNGQIKKGIILYCSMFLLFAVSIIFKLLYTFNGFIIFNALLVIIILYNVFDVVISAIRIREYELKSYNKWYIYLLVIIISQLFLSSIRHIILNVYPQLQAYYIPAGSMEPTLRVGDHIYVDKMYYKYHSPEHGDIVVYSPPGINTNKHYIHRCVAIEGDNVSLKNGYLYINNKRIVEDYAVGETTYDFYSSEKVEGKVPPGMIVVLGDNRQNSSDSRYFGYLPVNKIIGRPLYVYWSDESNRTGAIIK